MIYFNKRLKEIVSTDDGSDDIEVYPEEARACIPTKFYEAEMWQRDELKWINEQIEMKADGYRKAKGTSMANLRKYRNDVRDYYQGTEIAAEKPVRPE